WWAYGSFLPTGISSTSLGTSAGLPVSCISQIPAAEVVIQPPAAVVTIPGPVLSASCEPLSVGGNTPCTAGSYGLNGYGRGIYGLGNGYKRFLRGQSASICGYPC
uniref:Keratin n=1 Tax=Podarcis muralis TaxID=64176 RepID=A0A670JX62_PODMU